MITTGALLHGDVPRHLDFDSHEQPVALQLGGSDPADLATCAKLGECWGYAEINLNCGCPSERVARGSFGACLMAEPELVADCIRAMRDAVSVPVTVKHRIGLDKTEDYGFVRDFVGTVLHAGCQVFIVHARSAWLKGLSPKENRDIPPLRYGFVHRLRADFPSATFVLNGGITSLSQAKAELEHVDGVMLGRAAYHDPYLLASVDRCVFGDIVRAPSREEVAMRMGDYLERIAFNGVSARAVTAHMLGLYHGQANARRWRQRLSDPAFLAQHGAATLRAAEAVFTAPI
jgi:tRNA-dihydrouridine synthase A